MPCDRFGPASPFSFAEGFGERRRVVGAGGFEPPTSCSQSRRADQTAPRPEPGGWKPGKISWLTDSVTPRPCEVKVVSQRFFLAVTGHIPAPVFLCIFPATHERSLPYVLHFLASVQRPSATGQGPGESLGPGPFEGASQGHVLCTWLLTERRVMDGHRAGAVSRTARLDPLCSTRGSSPPLPTRVAARRMAWRRGHRACIAALCIIPHKAYNTLARTPRRG